MGTLLGVHPIVPWYKPHVWPLSYHQLVFDPFFNVMNEGQVTFNRWRWIFPPKNNKQVFFARKMVFFHVRLLSIQFIPSFFDGFCPERWKKWHILRVNGIEYSSSPAMPSIDFGRLDPQRVHTPHLLTGVHHAQDPVYQTIVARGHVPHLKRSKNTWLFLLGLNIL